MTNNGYNASPIDYDLHGIVGIRLLNASPSDIATVSRQLGPIRATLTREPDIIIKFVEQIALTSPVRYLGVDDAGFTDDAFLVLRGKHKSRVKVQIPFAQIGGQCQITCESGVSAVPLLLAIINLTALSKGVLPMHASAFHYNGVGVLTTGWAKGGKTETLLAFMAKGAKYIGDEWVYISKDGQRLYGIPEPIRIWDWHLQTMPQYWPLVKPRDRARLRALRLITQSADRMAGGSDSSVAKLMRRATPLLKHQLNVQLPPHKLFGQVAEPVVGALDKIFFVVSHEASTIKVEPTDPHEIGRRMVFSLQEERLEFMAYYFKFRFAFPEVHNELIETVEARQRALLDCTLAGKPAYTVSHPYPVFIPQLFDAISPFV
ncbi:MAG: hypothetical protein NT075_28480 [Chloroflexi bacterium]|nr:hypothetical protein [Chloroflexota bacterium]